MGCNLHKMPLRLHAPDPPDLRALFQLVPIQRIADVNQQERGIWHTFGTNTSCLRLTPQKRAKAVSILINYFQDDSSVVKTCSM